MTSTNSRTPGPSKWVALGLCIAALWPLGAWLADAWSAVSFPFPLDYGEGPLLDQARHLASLESIYRPLDAGPPWTVSNYPPVYPLALAAGVVLLGPTYAWGRCLSVLAALAVACCLGWTLYRRTGDWLAAGVAAVTFVLVPYVAFWSTLQRVDLLALALSWAAIAWMVGVSRPPVWPAAVFLAASVLTRQTFALAAPGALFVWLLLRGERRRALGLATWTGGLVAASVAILQTTTGGFLDHVLTANWNPWQLSRLPDFAVDALLLLPLLFLGAAIFAAWKPAAPRRDERDLRVFVLVYLGVSLVGAVAIGKQGSNVNYLLELCVALSLATGALFARLRPRPRWVLAASALLAAQWLAWIPPTPHETFTEVYRAAGDEAAAVLELLRETDGEVVTGQWLGLLPLADLDIVLPPHERKHLAALGRWDQAAAVDWLRRGEAERVLLYRPQGLEAWWQGMWTPELRAALDEGYVQERQIGSTVVLVPRRQAR